MRIQNKMESLRRTQPLLSWMFAPRSRKPMPMSTAQETAALRAELAQLRKDTDRLRKEVTELRQFINVEHDEDTGQPTNICISRCALIGFSRPDAPRGMQMLICAGPGDSGPCVSLYGSDEKGRIILSVEKDVPQIVINTPEHQNTVLLTADAEGRGLLAALDNGKPRALLKAGPDGAGVAAVVHDNGQARVCLRATEKDGELFVVNGELKTAIKLSSISQHGGGTLVLHGHGPKPAVILSTVQGLGGCIILNDPEGIPFVTLPDPQKMTDEELGLD